MKLSTAFSLLLALPSLSLAAEPCSPSEPRLGAVASESDICSRIGTSLLQLGGNAADALVGTVFCVGVIGMYHSGLGGGGFMLVRAPNGTYEFIDFREKAPAAAFESMYNNDTQASITGGLASGVPGELRGLQYLHENYGALPWKSVVMPAVRVARKGWKVNEDLLSYIESAGTEELFVTDPTWALDFAPRGKLLGLGEMITRKRLANTLETIAEEGPDAFYTGAIAAATINALQAANGTMTMEDLANYTVEIRDVSQIDYRGYKLTSTSAPSSGAVALSILNILGQYEGAGDPAKINLTTHRFDEAMRFGYGMRTNLGDPLYVEGLRDYELSMIANETAAELRGKISDRQSFNVSHYNPNGTESLDTPGTSHVVTADADGMAISLTTTVNLLFGSQLMIPETGVIMNNEMNDFSIPGVSNAFGFVPSPANFVRPGKRPLSSISPVIAEFPNGTFYLATGAAGGSRIITSTIQNVWHVLDQGLSVPEALAVPRFHDQLVPNTVQFEVTANNETTAFLRSLGHNVTFIPLAQSSAQGLRLLGNGTFEAGGEPRQKNSGGFAV